MTDTGPLGVHTPRPFQLAADRSGEAGDLRAFKLVRAEDRPASPPARQDDGSA
jgi:hypothetical protein